MRNLVRIVLLSFVCSWAGSAYAVQITSIMKECVNCTAMQMQTMAKNQPLGYHFIYDLAHNVIRKYEVYMDSTCAQQPVVQSGTGSGRQIQSAGRLRGPGTDCASFKAADEVFPVNAGVQAVFDSLRSVWLVDPTFANSARVEVADMPVVDGYHYNASKIAWDYPQGDFRAFRDYLRDRVLNNRTNANAYAEGLGDFIFGVSVAVNSIDVGTPPQVLNVKITLDRPSATVHLLTCDSFDVCVDMDIKILNGQVDSIVYNGTFDSENMMLPSQSGQTPGQLTGWHWQYANDADRFSSMLHNNSHIPIPIRPGCGGAYHWGLQVARVNGVANSATWTCIPND